MKQLNLKGTYYEMGLQMGEILKNTDGYPPKFPKEVLEKSKAYEEQAKIYTPDLLEEFRGISDALDIDYYVPIALELTPMRFQTIQCLVFAVSGVHTESGLPVLARSHEWDEEDSENLRVCHSEPEGKLKSLGFTFSWTLVSRYGGMNEAGLALSSASATFEHSEPGIILNIATRWILDNCKTTEEAVEFLEKIPKVWGECYMIIDKTNTIAKVQTHYKKTIVEYSKRGFESVTLQYDSPELLSMVSDSFEGCQEVYEKRQNFLNNWFNQNKGKINNKMIIDALKNHEHQMCSHGPEGLEICWSYILELAKNEALVCAGRPCKNDFISIKSFN